MVNFIPNKINPDKEPDKVRSVSSTPDRKPPAGNYDQVAKEVDKDSNQDASEDDNISSSKDSKEKVQVDVEDAAPPVVNFFDLGKTKLSDQQLAAFNVSNAPAPIATQAPLPAPVAAPITPVKVPKAKGAETKGDADQSIFTPETVSNLPKKEKANPFEAIEQPDLASVSQATYVPVAPINTVSSTAPVQAPPHAQAIQEVIDQIAKAVYDLKLDGKTETVVELKGVFEGSQLKVTEFSTARGQMNITIDNLTAAGQLVIEANKGVILEKLADIDIRVPIFLASSTMEGPRIETAKADVYGRGAGNTGQEQKKEDNPRHGQRG